MTQSVGPQVLGQRMLAAVMFTDVVEFSRLVGEDEVRSLRLVQRDLRAIHEICGRFSGKVIKLTGDGCLAFFTSGVHAVECAQQIQRQFLEQAQYLPAKEVLRHRIGIHLGDVFVNNTDVLGDGVNIAARLQGEAPPGGICISQALYEVVRTRLSLHTQEVGPRRLKNIAEDVMIYQVVVGVQGMKKPPLPVAKAAPAAPSARNLPSWWVWAGASVLLLGVVIGLLVVIISRRPPVEPMQGQGQFGGPPPSVNGALQGAPEANASSTGTPLQPSAGQGSSSPTNATPPTPQNEPNVGVQPPHFQPNVGGKAQPGERNPGMMPPGDGQNRSGPMGGQHCPGPMGEQMRPGMPPGGQDQPGQSRQSGGP